MSCQSVIIKSPIQPPPEFSACPINVPGSIFVPNWSLPWRQDFQRFQPQNGFTGPSNGVPNLVSYCDFLCASLSCIVSQRTETVTMLQTRFVLFIENSMIRRCNIANFKLLRMMNTVPLLLPGRFLHGARAVFFVTLQTSQFGLVGKCVETLCLPVGLLVFGLLDLSARNLKIV